MSVVKSLNLITVEEYLARELESPVKHEYLGGIVYAMAGARNAHNIIATNTLASLHAQLPGKRCRVFNSDTKIRVRLPTRGFSGNWNVDRSVLASLEVRPAKAVTASSREGLSL